MSTEAIDVVALESLLTRHISPAGEDDPMDSHAEHPLARELRTVLASPGTHGIGDLARVVDSILKEMAMFKAAHGIVDPTDN